MGRLLVLVCAALLCLATRATAKKPAFILTAPVSMISGDAGKVCLNMEISEPLDITVVMEHDGKNTSIIAEDAGPQKYFQCGAFTVPKVTETVPVAIIMWAKGANTDVRERQTVVLKSAPENCMFQMDKPIYKPDQKVNFRFLCLNAQLKPVTVKISSVNLQDPSRAKIAQWVLPKADHGIISLDFQLIREATPGSYVITAERESGYPFRQYFSVERYVIPRFTLEVEAPQTVSMTAEEVKFSASSMYTFGEPMAGSVTVRLCKQPVYYGRRQNCFKDKTDSCTIMTGKLDEEGKYNGVIDMYSPFMRNARGASISMDITVTEEGTEIQVTESRYVSVTSQPARLSFDYESQLEYYMRDVPYPVMATLTDENNKPMPNQEIEVQINNGEPEIAMTDADGRIEHLIDTSNMVDTNFTVKISYVNPDQCYYEEWSRKDYPSSEYTVQRFYSKSGSFFQMRRRKGELSTGETHSMQVDYIISEDGTGPGVTTATMYYMVMSKSAIVHSGQKEIDLSTARNGSVVLDLPVTFEMAPSAVMIVYAMLRNEIVADSVNLNVEKTFQNLVSFTFSEEKVMPGSKVEVQLSADPNSFCAVRVIDSGLMILNPYESFSADRVYNARRFYSYGYDVDGINVEGPEPPCVDPDKLMFHQGAYYVQTSSPSEGDTYSKLKAIGLLMATGLTLRKPVVCDKNPPPPQYITPMAGTGGGFGGGGGFAPEANMKFASLEMDSPGGASRGAGGGVSTVRENFAETMLWVSLLLDTQGRATLKEKVPDSITKWLGSAFCTSEESGFGMTRYTSNLTTYLPFFGELSLPYSFQRGETLVMTAVVRNYMPHCAKVQVTLENSDAYTAVLKEGKQDACVCANGRASYTWEVDAKQLGEISFSVTAKTTHIGQSCDGPNDPSQPSRSDTVVQTTIVEPEGIPQQLTSSHLVYVKGNNVQLPITIAPPANVVPGTPSAYVTAVSDFIGLQVQNLEDLVRKPTGCAEQVLARMAYIPHVLNYLNATGKLTDNLLQKAKGYMSEGYYRLLGFASGGGYRVFRSSRERPNTFLTAYAVKTLEAASQYIYVDPDRQKQSMVWLENAQNLETGCFRSQGTLFSVEDVDNDLFVTTYVAITLMESQHSLGKTMLTGAMECLKNATKSKQNITDEVMMLYAFTLANLAEHREPLRKSLMKKVIIEGGLARWEPEGMPKRPIGQFFRRPFAPIDVIITSYMLLSLASAPSVNQEDLNLMGQTSMWLGRQQNAYGGFLTTQDTVVGIQAMTKFATLLKVPPNSKQTIVIRRGNGEVSTMELNEDTSLLVHRAALPEANGDYAIDVSGNGWCMMQTTVEYNIPVPKENSAYSLSLVTSSESCQNGVAYGFTVNGSVSYNGAHNATGMAMMRVRLLSGYSIDYSSINKITEVEGISKWEEGPRGELIVYLMDVPKEPINFSFKLLMTQRVLNVKAASAVVYSYYRSDENGYASYKHPCAGSTQASS